MPEDRMYLEVSNALSEKSKSKQISLLNHYMNTLSTECIYKKFDENMSSTIIENWEFLNLQDTGKFLRWLVITGHEPSNKEKLKEVASQKLREQKLLFGRFTVLSLCNLAVMNMCPEELLLQAMENIETARKGKFCDIY